MRDIVNASPGIVCTAIDEVRLCQSLAIVPTDAFDALSFSGGRLIVETRRLSLCWNGIRQVSGGMFDPVSNSGPK